MSLYFFGRTDALAASTFENPVPVNDTNPYDDPLICVSFNESWLPIILGALQGLIQPNAYNTGDDAAITLQQQRAATLLDLFMKQTPCATPCTDRQDGGFTGDEMGITCDCDGNVSITCQDGTTRQILTADQVKALIAPIPGTGAPQAPAGGGNQCYHAALQANSRYLLPTVVSSGDVLELIDAQGQGNDGTLSPWWTPSGHIFFIVDTGTGGVLTSSDPIPTSNHMRLIYNIGGTFYDAMAGPVTVPGGVLNAQVEIQVNDSALADNAGAYTFQICKTNNQLASWSHVLDLQFNPHHFVVAPHNDACTGDRGNYRYGVGFETIAEGGTGCVRYMYVQADYFWSTATEISSVDLEYDVVYGSVGGDPFELALQYYDAATTITNLQTVMPPVTGNDLHMRGTSPVTAKGLRFFLWTGDNDTDSAHMGYGRAFRLSVTGRGFDPFAT